VELWRDAQRDARLIAMAKALDGGVALELGGPSRVFGHPSGVPVYKHLAALDTLDFSEQTIWSAARPMPSAHRRSFVGEASTLDGIEDRAYDAVLASHVLEHVADPLGALARWQRAVRPGGHVLLVMPHREGTFDHRRPVTPIEHLIEDAEHSRGEDDVTHLEEIFALHDLGRDPGAGDRAAFEARCRDNVNVRGMHHHVFDTQSTAAMCAHAGLEVLAIVPKKPFNIFCLARVVRPQTGDDNVADGYRAALDEAKLAQILAGSPFEGDRPPGEALAKNG
jgi:SAM-dependent methyltransferase